MFACGKKGFMLWGETHEPEHGKETGQIKIEFNCKLFLLKVGCHIYNLN